MGQIKKYKNFLITGFGRSGTKFLATIMNYSKKWNVYHEPRGEDDIIVMYNKNNEYNNIVKKDFLKDNYGEVNSYLRLAIKKIKINKLGIIIRNPYDIYLSCMNRNKSALDVSADLFKSYLFFLRAYEKNILFIDFKKMTTDVEYLKKVCIFFNIKDVTITEKIIKSPINVTTNKKYNTYEDIPKDKRKIFEYYNWELLMNDIGKKLNKNNKQLFNGM